MAEEPAPTCASEDRASGNTGFESVTNLVTFDITPVGTVLDIPLALGETSIPLPESDSRLRLAAQRHCKVHDLPRAARTHGCGNHEAPLVLK
jgi:hypothetical protein